MLMALWHYLRGYVMIEVSGTGAERFINLAARRGVYFWSVERVGATVTMHISVKAFRLLKACARKSGCRVKIARRFGWPFVVYRYRKRRVLAGGLLFFVLALYGLSLFVWQVDITGTERLRPSEVTAFLDEQGLASGTFKGRVDTRVLERALMSRFGDIAWVNIRMRGTRATVEIAETLPPQLMIDRSTPCHVVAAKDGLILSVAASAGRPLVRENDVVRRGDILVSGELLYQDNHGVNAQTLVHAKAEVLARLYYEMNFEVPFDYIENRVTGEIKRTYAVMAFDRVFHLPGRRVPFENFEQHLSRRQLRLGQDFPLPVMLLTTTYREFVPEPRTRTPAQARELAERLTTGRIIREFDFLADIIDKQINVVEMSHGILVQSLVTTIEDIGQQVLIFEN